jgi:hypothetical protein
MYEFDRTMYRGARLLAAGVLAFLALAACASLIQELARTPPARSRRPAMPQELTGEKRVRLLAGS